MCGKEVEPDRAKYRFNNLGAETVYFCSKQCWENYRKEIDRLQRERAAQEDAGGGKAGQGQASLESAEKSKK